MIYTNLINIYSYEFFAFLIMYALLYYLIPGRYKAAYLILLSILFYLSINPAMLIIPLFLAFVSYCFGRIFTGKRNKILLFISIILSILPLIFFKYFNFFSININSLSRVLGWNYSPFLLELILPVGISFYTFKAISYIIDVYRQTSPPEKRFHFIVLYLLYFPSVIAGPINRSKPLFEQFEKLDDVDPRMVKAGIMLFLWGLFQKVIVADRLSVVVDKIFNHVPEYHAFHFLLAAFFFAIQIYCDFSGYTDIALGTSLLFGIKLIKNFNNPYSAKSVADFWRRWHISLTSWFGDYLFLPVSYALLRRLKRPLLNIKPEVTAYSASVFIVLITAGFWHGAGWTFIIWGFILAFFMFFSVFTRKLRRSIIKKTRLYRHKKFLAVFRTAFTFLLICSSWIFFRSNSLDNSIYIFKEIFTGYTSLSQSVFNLGTALSYNLTGLSKINLLLSVLCIIAIFYQNLANDDSFIYRYSKSLPAAVKYGGVFIIAVGIFLFGNFSTPQFIYLSF